MKCDGCKHANWKRTAAGKLHPDRTGRCEALAGYSTKIVLPAAFYFIFEPNPSGGFIARGDELPRHCDFKVAE